MPVRNIVYLFGAGATHAEMLNIEAGPSANFRNQHGLLISDVSKRVMKAAQQKTSFRKDLELVSSPQGSLNIELLISLISTSQIHDSDAKANTLKQLVKRDIEAQLTKGRKQRFYLHKALFELHELIKNREQVLAVISLNYDDVLDEALAANGEAFDYCHTLKDTGELPLLKLHGSFNWISMRPYGRRRRMSIIPLGIQKNYLSPPYNFIWSKALDLLVRCDVLRIIGCSLNQNDVGLVDLLFKAHLERTSPLEIEIIDFQPQGDVIKGSYGFFPRIFKPTEVEDALIKGELIEDPSRGGNPFKIWLGAKAHKMVEDDIPKTRFLRKCC